MQMRTCPVNADLAKKCTKSTPRSKRLLRTLWTPAQGGTASLPGGDPIVTVCLCFPVHNLTRRVRLWTIPRMVAGVGGRKIFRRAPTALQRNEAPLSTRISRQSHRPEAAFAL